MKINKISQVLDNENQPIHEEDLVCPFCKETGFDAIGLKSHLLHGDCELFNNIKTIERVNF